MISERAPGNAEKTGRFFYGYVIVSSSVIVMTMTFGINYSFGVFFKPILAEFGWSRASASTAYSLMAVMSGFLGIFAGRLSDYFGPKIIGILAGLFLAAGCLLLSQTQNIWHFYFFHGVVLAAGIGGCWPGLMPAVSKWFTARRGLMTGIVSSGVGFGTITHPPLTEWLIFNHGWRTAYFIIGLLTLLLVVGVSQFLKRDPAQVGQLPYGFEKAEGDKTGYEIGGHSFKEATRTKQFWLLGTVYVCYGYCLHTTMVHIVPHVQDMGFSASHGAKILALIGVTSIFARIVIGSASDRYGVKPSLLAGLLVLALSFLLVQIATTLPRLYFYATLFGIAYGGVISLQTLAAGELFGLRSLGIVLGTIAFLYILGGAVGAIISGYIYDKIGSYGLAFWIAEGFSLLALVLTFLLRMPPKAKTETP
jgi:MFS family permease